MDKLAPTHQLAQLHLRPVLPTGWVYRCSLDAAASLHCALRRRLLL